MDPIGAPPELARFRRETYFAPGQLPLRMKRHVEHAHNRPHDHEFMEIALVAEGTGTHYSALGRQTISPGDVFVLRPGAWHVHHDCQDLVIYNCLLGPEVLHRDVPAALADPSINYLLETRPRELDQHGIFAFQVEGDSEKRCRAHLETMEVARTDIEKLGHFILLLTELSRALERSSPGLPRRTKTVPPAVLECLRLMETSPQEEWPVERLAAHVNFDRHYLMRLFKRHLGVSLGQYLQRCRAERAAALLSETGLSISAIGASVGWPDPNYFARRFKQYYGISASECRRQANKDANSGA